MSHSTYISSKQLNRPMRLLGKLLLKVLLVIALQTASLTDGNAQTTCTDSLAAVKRNYATTIKVAEALAKECDKKDAIIESKTRQVELERTERNKANTKTIAANERTEIERKKKNGFAILAGASILAHLIQLIK